jgi:hypothetical protein
MNNGRVNVRLCSARSARVLLMNGFRMKDLGSLPTSRRLTEPVIDRTSRESLQALFAFLRKRFSKHRFWDFGERGITKRV